MELARWPEEALDLLRRLEGDVSLDAYREEHDRLVRHPMELLCDALGDVGGYGGAWLTARTVMPATWRRTGANIWVAQRVYLAAVLDVDGLHVEGGWTCKSTEQLWRYRAMVDDASIAAGLVEILAELSANGYALTDDSLTKMPRGYSADHPRAELILRRTCVAVRPLGASPDVVADVSAALEGLLPLVSWFAENVATARRGG